MIDLSPSRGMLSTDVLLQCAQSTALGKKLQLILHMENIQSPTKQHRMLQSY